ncbi:MerR family transcriptional regulator [Nonomuraea sp. NPDC050383]|uniref:MerR family transcriptional regulator n=1 Tax=Nonomuraea sp. NPDC050383 TaxID=3364362 RepID=UPI0037A7EE9C
MITPPRGRRPRPRRRPGHRRAHHPRRGHATAFHADVTPGQKPADPELPGSRRLLRRPEAARRTGVSAHTLRYHERAGLVVTTVERTAGGRRRYHRIGLEWIVVCTRQATGMPIRAIRRYVELVTAGHGNEQEPLSLVEAHRAEVTAKLAELQENLKLIDHKIDVYRGRLAADDADRLWTPVRPGAAKPT